MNLASWLTTEGMRLTDFAAATGYPVSTVHGWRSGRRFPRGRALAEIERVTGGKVRASDFVATPPEAAE